MQNLFHYFIIVSSKFCRTGKWGRGDWFIRQVISDQLQTELEDLDIKLVKTLKNS
jgi:hypothetical protein